MNYKFEAVIYKVPDKDGAFIKIPFDVEKEFGAKRVKVKAEFNEVQYRGSIVNMGVGCPIIGITKAIRAEIGKTIGDTIDVEIEKDEDVREIELPEDFKVELMKNEKAFKFYEGLSYSAKKKYCNWITSAKRKETREKRIIEGISKLEENIKIK